MKKLNKEKNTLKEKIEVKRKVHNIYSEWIGSGKMFRQLVGKWQFIYSSPKGKISCVKFLDYFCDGKDFWEIYSLDGDLFEDVERFDSKKEAEKQIKKYL